MAEDSRYQAYKPRHVENLDQILTSTFGFAGFRPGQAEAVESLAEGRHTLVVMPTGAGKSLIYQFAAVTRPGLTLVVSPLISLMQDQVDALSRRRIPATFINSSIPVADQSQRLAAMADGRYRLVYVAPERLRSTAFQDALAKVNVGLLAVDEAHCVSHWGHDFRPDYLHIAAARQKMGNPLTAALTATATPEVRTDIACLLGLSDVNHIVTGFNRPNLTFAVNYCRDVPGKLRALLELIRSLHDGAAIVYAGTRRDTEEVADFISEAAGVRSLYYHGGMSSEARERAQNEFMSGRVRIIAATNSFGMGIDRADVRLVAHYAMPGSLEAYYQEAGRAGRDGSPARVTLLYSPDDRALHEWFIEHGMLGADDVFALHVALARESWWSSDDLSIATGLHQVAVRVGLSVLESVGAAEVLSTDGVRLLIRQGRLDEDALDDAMRQARLRADHKRAQLDRMVNYAESNACRRRIILDHFGDPGEASAPDCCDNCLSRVAASSQPDNRTGELTRENKTALLILDTIRSIRWGIGRGKLARVLFGSKSREITRLGYDRNPRYGKLSVLRCQDIERLIDDLEQMGYIKAIGANRPVLQLTGRGEAALASKQAIPLRFPRSIAIDPRKRQAGQIYQPPECNNPTPRSDEQPIPVRVQAEESVTDLLAALDGDDAHIRLTAIKALGRIRDPRAVEPLQKIASDEQEGRRVRALAEQSAQMCGVTTSQTTPRAAAGFPIKPEDRALPPAASDDPVAAYLGRSHPRQLAGPWRTGWALGFHSSFSGSDWKRSGVGDMAFRLKYRADASALQPLVDEAFGLCREHPELAGVDVIVPVPPSTARALDPVSRFCEELGHKLKLPVRPIVTRTRQTQPQKQMRTLAQKRANVAGAFAAAGSLRGQRLLVVDDLYDSGATLEEVVRALTRAGAASLCVLTLTRTIHSDA